jgi:putative FmdB family regulatory protein
MPLYEYQCGACGHRFEQIRKFSDSPVEVCPSCGARQVSKLLSSPAIQFKGSGWYITDYARKGAGATDAAGKTDKAEKPAGKDTDTKSSPSDTSTSSSSSGTTGTAPAPSTSKQS